MMRVVKFKDGTYGVRKTDYTNNSGEKYIYLNLHHFSKWHEHMSPEFFSYCKTKYINEAIYLYKQYMDKGEPIPLNEIYNIGKK